MFRDCNNEKKLRTDTAKRIKSDNFTSQYWKN